MRYNPNVHHQRSIRLPAFDYRQVGAYFITICTHQRELVLDNEEVSLLVGAEWQGLKTRFPTIALDQFVIMPNHVHGIIILSPGRVQGAASSEGAASGAPTLGQVMRAFKSRSGVAANRLLGASGRPFWQRNYYERVIRNEDELNRIRQYIIDNPAKWAEDKNNPVKWS